MPSLSDWIFGSSPQLSKKPTGTAEQQQFGQNLIGQANQFGQQGGGLDSANNYFQGILGSQGGQGEAYNKFSQPYMQQFEQQILPMIAERFAGHGALSSSGFGQSLGGAGAGLQSQLAQLFSSLQGGAAQQQYGQYNQMANTGLGYQPFAYHEKQGMEGFLAPFLTKMAQTAMQAGMGG